MLFQIALRHTNHIPPVKNQCYQQVRSSADRDQKVRQVDWLSIKYIVKVRAKKNRPKNEMSLTNEFLINRRLIMSNRQAS